jgi:hypothetical protein
LLVNGVSATKEVKQLLDGIVSSMMGGEKDDGKEKNMLNSGVSALGETDEKLLMIGVSATKEAKQLLDGIVSWMMGGEKNDGKGKKRNKC